MKKNTEKTSSRVATMAGMILQGRAVRDAEAWLERLASGQATSTDEDCQHAATLLTTLEWARSIAGSALTQKG